MLPLEPLVPLFPPGLSNPLPPLGLLIFPGLLGFPGLLWLPDLLELPDPLEPPAALPDLLEELPELLEPLMPPRLVLVLRSSPLESRPGFPLSFAIHPPAPFGTCLLLSTKQFGVNLRAGEKGKVHAICSRNWRP